MMMCVLPPNLTSTKVINAYPEEMQSNNLLHARPKGYTELPGDFYIDPVQLVDRAFITHGYSNHACFTDYAKMLATCKTLYIMAISCSLSFAPAPTR